MLILRADNRQFAVNRQRRATRRRLDDRLCQDSVRSRPIAVTSQSMAARKSRGWLPRRHRQPHQGDRLPPVFIHCRRYYSENISSFYFILFIYSPNSGSKRATE